MRTRHTDLMVGVAVAGPGRGAGGKHTDGGGQGGGAHPQPAVLGPHQDGAVRHLHLQSQQHRAGPGHRAHRARSVNIILASLRVLTFIMEKC